MQKENKQLKRERDRKDKALAEAATLLGLEKKGWSLQSVESKIFNKKAMIFYVVRKRMKTTTVMAENFQKIDYVSSLKALPQI